MPVLRIRMGAKTVEKVVPAGVKLSDALREALGWYLLPCGGRGVCGHCKVRVLVNGLSAPTEVERLHNAVHEYRLACQARIERDTVVEVETYRRRLITYGVEPRDYDLDPLADGYGLAFDVGSLKIAAALVDLRRGRTLEHSYTINPQASWGVDVISRITRVINDPRELEEMSRCTIDAVHRLGKRLLAKVGRTEPDYVVFTGNSVALPIMLGIDPSPLGYSPYENPLREYVCLEAREAGLPWRSEMLVLPPIRSFVGSDASTLTVSAVMHGFTKNALYIDLGINTEVVYCAAFPKLYVTSAPAGPAIEGGRLSCGTSALEGGAEYARYDPSSGTVRLVPEGERLKGLTGSAIVSLIASLLEGGVLEPSGRIVRPSFIREGVRCFSIHDSLVLSQLDVREFQKAKAAVGAACARLFRIHGRGPGVVILAGSLGTLVDPRDAERIGLIPTVDLVLQFGNLALVGAKLYMVSREARKIHRAIYGNYTYVSLLGDKEYEELWLRHLRLEPFGP